MFLKQKSPIKAMIALAEVIDTKFSATKTKSNEKQDTQNPKRKRLIEINDAIEKLGRKIDNEIERGRQPERIFEREYCNKAYWKLKNTLNKIREEDKNWVENNDLYTKFDDVLEKLHGFSKSPNYPEYNSKFYDGILTKYDYKRDSYFDRLDKTIATSNKNQLRLTRNTLEGKIKMVKKDVDKIIEKNPEVINYFGVTTLDKCGDNIHIYGEHMPICALAHVKHYLKELETRRNRLNEITRYNPSQKTGLFSKVKRFFGF